MSEATKADRPLPVLSSEGLGPNAQLMARLRNGAAPLDDPNLNDEAAEAIAQLYAELQREHADHAQTVEDAAKVARENATLLSRIELLRGISDEYNKWISFHFAGDGDFDDFIRRIVVPRGA